MSDLREDNWMESPFATREDLAAETKTVLATLAREMEKQLYHLNKTHTVALMAAEIYGKTTIAPEVVAKALYFNVQKTLEIDDTITKERI